MQQQPDPPVLQSIIVLPWPDPMVDAFGHDPRSPYVERFWLGILGPSTTWLLRRFAEGFDDHPEGYELDLSVLAFELGLGAGQGRHGSFTRTLQRCVQFGLAHPHSHGLSVRRRVPPLTQRQVSRLPAPVQAAHRAWADDEDDRRHEARARTLAAAIVAAGTIAAAQVERDLQLVGVPPRISVGAARWALERVDRPTADEAAEAA